MLLVISILAGVGYTVLLFAFLWGVIRLLDAIWEKWLL